mgnify:CR=1 FL=1
MNVLGNKLNAILGKNIHKYRTYNSLSIDQLSGLAGINPKSLINIEKGRGNPKVDTIEKIAAALCIDPQHLFMTDDDVSEQSMQVKLIINNEKARPAFLSILNGLNSLSDEVNK